MVPNRRLQLQSNYTPTSTSTNRLTTAGTGYDAAGNLTAWSGNSYEYDAFNLMTRMVSGAED